MLEVRYLGWSPLPERVNSILILHAAWRIDTWAQHMGKFRATVGDLDKLVTLTESIRASLEPNPKVSPTKTLSVSFWWRYLSMWVLTFNLSLAFGCDLVGLAQTQIKNEICESIQTAYRDNNNYWIVLLQPCNRLATYSGYPASHLYAGRLHPSDGWMDVITRLHKNKK